MKLARWLFAILEGSAQPRSTHASGLGRSKLFDAVTRASLEKNYEDWKRDHADLDAKVSSRKSFTTMAADVLGDRFNPELFWLYGLPSLIVHGKPHGNPDVLRLAGSNQLERSPNSNWFTSTDQLMKAIGIAHEYGKFLASSYGVDVSVMDSLNNRLGNVLVELGITASQVQVRCRG